MSRTETKAASKRMSIMDELERIAVERYDGHFTVMRFTSNWRVCFDTMECAGHGLEFGECTARMAEGNTFEEAAKAAIDFEIANPKGWYERLSPGHNAAMQAFKDVER
jgi:hypothetical protein